MKSVATVLCLLMIGIAGSVWAQGGSVDKGKALVESKKCHLCHKEGSKLGKPMNALAAGKDDAHLKAAITDPKKALGPQVKMPAFKLSDAELADVIAYLKSLAKP
jgi:cytochrome c1